MRVERRSGAWCDLISLTAQTGDIEIASDRHTIGRKEYNDTQIKNYKLSAVHCIITREKQPDGSFSYYVQDLSSNGTHHNKVKIGIEKKVEIKDGDEIMLLNNKHVPDKGKYPF
eukprot:TRINITY_DN6947_c0_g2_i1.p1 TRINITY_DN6947_c0_g2~~TRINITY_DN6947_c0_g2_i1.p1  ORF type:complete len:114 (-),score=18.19 TRINITY_DN6947_c0_g2_i1:1-342(-)